MYPPLETLFIYGDLPSNVEGGSYQLPLVVLSYLVASFASYTALTMAQQLVTSEKPWEKRLFHWGGSFAMGAGIWSMHFIGMLSYKMRMVVTYDPLLTVFSMIIAIIVAYGALAIAAERLTRGRLLIGGTLLGLGICGMHYTGMAAMQMDGILRYKPDIFFLSVVIAITAAVAALWMAFTLSRHGGRFRDLFQIGAALVMGAAICGMHYTGMSAAVFIPYADCRFDPNQNFDALAMSIAIITTVILIIALSIGIYKRTQTELQLQVSETRLRTIIDGALDAIVGMDQQGRIVEWNKQAEAVFGWSHEEALNKPLSEVIIPPAYREAHSIGLQKFLKGGVGPILNKRIEMTAINRQGTEFPIELAVSVQWLEDSYQFTAFVRDITRRKETEAQLLSYTRELERSNEGLDDFTYIVSHDLKEPLRGLQSFSQFLLEDYEDKLDEEGKKKLHTISRLTQHLETLLDTLLHYSRVGRSALAIVETDLNDVVRKAVDMLSISLKEKNTTVEILQKLPVVSCDRVRIGEVFQNLISNALKYNDHKENKIEIGTVTDHPRMPGKTVFYVRDHGIGVPEKHLETIFKMFKRLHAKDAYGGGTGSGLAIVRKIITQHGGEIWAESKGEGQGTTFFFTLQQPKK